MNRRTPVVSVFALLLCVAVGLCLGWTPARPALAAEGPNVAEAPGPKSLDELRAIERRVKDAAAKVLPCTVGVQVGHSAGSGVVVSEDGLVMTAGHMIEKPGQQVRFFFPDGKTAKGTTLGAYKTGDAGLAKIEEPGKWPFAHRGSSAGLKAGAWCVAMGHPLGVRENRPPVLRVGRVLQLGDAVLQTDCSLVGGDSGGPLVDLDGKVIGINSRIGTAMEHNFHVPVDVYNDNWDRLLKGDVWESDLPKRDTGDIKAMLRQVVADAGKCTVRVKCGGKDAALGTIVGPDGWILTKASELKDKTVCCLRDQREFEARLVGVDRRYDLAMLKIDQGGLPAVAWSDAGPSVGQWVAAAGLADDPLALGVVSVPLLPIPGAPGVLGIAVRDLDGDGAAVDTVLPGSPAEKVGLQKDDVVLKLNGGPIANRMELISRVRKLRPGDEVTLTVHRGGQQLEIKATLANIDTPAARKREMQNALGVGMSHRRDAFPMVLQHDAVVRPVDCGGPLVDLGGKVVGVNIARGGRTETYCVPSESLLPLLYELMSGRLPPQEDKGEGPSQPQHSGEDGPDEDANG